MNLYTAHALLVRLATPSRASFDVSPYAWTSPPVPSRVPPKYLTTTHMMSDSPDPLRLNSIGFPAVPDGSPLSLLLSCLDDPSYTAAQQ